jgi:hypothetical protein
VNQGQFCEKEGVPPFSRTGRRSGGQRWYTGSEVAICWTVVVLAGGLAAGPEAAIRPIIEARLDAWGAALPGSSANGLEGQAGRLFGSSGAGCCRRRRLTGHRQVFVVDIEHGWLPLRVSPPVTLPSLSSAMPVPLSARF